MAQSKPNQRQKARKAANQKKKDAAKKGAAVTLSDADLKRIEDGEFRVDELDLLRLQRDNADFIMWRERLEAAQRQVQEVSASGNESAEAFNATMNAVREKWGLEKTHGVILKKGPTAGVVMVIEEQVAPMAPCPKCKQQMPTTFGFCGSCGHSMKDEEAPEVDESATPEPAAEETAPPEGTPKDS